MTKGLVHVFTIEVSHFLKIFIAFFIAIPFASSQEKDSLFFFSKERGLESVPTSKTPEKEQNNIAQDYTNGKTEPSNDNSEENIKEETEKSENIQHSISEDFAPQEEDRIQGIDFLDIFSGDVSWFFQKKKTKHKVAITPIYSFNRTQSFRLGLRFFAYSSDKKGYYFAFSGSRYLFRPFARFDMSYYGNRRGSWRFENSFLYDNHYENYFGENGMKSRLSDLKKLYAHHLAVGHKIFYQKANQNFYLGLGAQLFFRKERPNYHPENKRYFEDEFFLFFKTFFGYDSRNNWKNPRSGSFHQLSFGCKSVFAYPGVYCKGEGDFRFYLSLFKNTDFHHSLKDSILAFRVFAGSSFLSPSTYFTAYRLGGQNLFENVSSLRGFKQNRFLGDKIYLTQSELRFPVWDKYIEGVLFFELGEVMPYNKGPENFVVDYGGGLRIGLPPNYDMKIRIDFGIAEDLQKEQNSNFMISFLQAF